LKITLQIKIAALYSSFSRVKKYHYFEKKDLQSGKKFSKNLFLLNWGLL